mmetsp:Transcript_21620/g.57856  ORF Transcript_21620/g.57856 Transcript_21620/m.57856 type:complete len:1108 (+) Transcript_21620:46-3369(+)
MWPDRNGSFDGGSSRSGESSGLGSSSGGGGSSSSSSSGASHSNRSGRSSVVHGDMVPDPVSYRSARSSHPSSTKSQQLPADTSVFTTHSSKKSLLAPLPNLFRATFEQAQRQAPGEVWLQQRIHAFDTGGRQRRKHVLEEFLEYIGQSTASSMEELFSNQAHLLFIRLTSWFSITLPMFFELPLQLKVFLTFLEFREQSFIRAFFESGTVVPLMHTLSVDFDVPDEVRCLAINVLHKLAANGRQHKELLCSQGLITNILDCASDGLRWETLKFAGRLLCELFHSNPQYQAQVLDALQDFMIQRLPLTQRVGTQAFISLLTSEGHTLSPLLSDPARHRILVQRALSMLESHDLRVGADAYCLLCRLLRSFDCDDLLLDFARRQLRTENSSTTDWLRVEMDAQFLQNEGEDATAPRFGGRHFRTVNRLHACISAALAGEGGPPDETDGGTELIRRINRSNAEFCDAFRAEAGCILKWGLLIYLSKRSSSLCAELVDGGLTETLLMCLLDVSHPVRQAAALAELQRLQLLSAKSKAIVRAVLVRRDLLEAIALDQFMGAATPDDLSQARCRLRNMRQKGSAFGAKEHFLNQQLMEQEMADTLDVRGPTMDVFLTEGPEMRETTHNNDSSTPKVDSDTQGVNVPRSGAELFAVKRVPATGTTDLYRIDRGSVDEIPFRGSLASFLTDPLELVADEESPLIQELRNIEACVGLGGATAKSASTAVERSEPSRRRRGPRKPLAHKLDVDHCRALALRQVPPPGIEARPKVWAPRHHESISDSMSVASTELSLRIAGPEDSFVEQPQRCGHRAVACPGCRLAVPEASKHSHLCSLADTTVGVEQMLEFSVATGSGAEDISKEFGSISQPDALAAGHSIMTAGTESLPLTASWSDKHLSTHLDLNAPLLANQGRVKAYLARRSPLTAEVEIHRHFLPLDLEQGSIGVDGIAPPRVRVQKRILHVTRAPYHDCVAFDKAEYERERANGGADVSGLMHPGTRKRFEDLEIAGKFPRRAVVGRDPKSARLPYRPTSSFDARRHFLRSAAGKARHDVQLSEGSSSTPRDSPSAGAAREYHSSVAESSPLPDLRLPKVGAAAGAVGSLKSFFPASVYTLR